MWAYFVSTIWKHLLNILQQKNEWWDSWTLLQYIVSRERLYVFSYPVAREDAKAFINLSLPYQLQFNPVKAAINLTSHLIIPSLSQAATETPRVN